LPRPFFPNQNNNNKTKYEAARNRECSLKKDIKCVVVRPFNNRTASTKQKNSRRMKDLKFTTIKRKSFFCCVFFIQNKKQTVILKVCVIGKKTLND